MDYGKRRRPGFLLFAPQTSLADDTPANGHAGTGFYLPEQHVLRKVHDRSATDRPGVPVEKQDHPIAQGHVEVERGSLQIREKESVLKKLPLAWISSPDRIP